MLSFLFLVYTSSASCIWSFSSIVLAILMIFLQTCYCECSYYLAKKKIPSIHGNTMGVKLQQFIFDAFSYAPSTAHFEVPSFPPLLSLFFLFFFPLIYNLLLSFQTDLGFLNHKIYNPKNNTFLISLPPSLIISIRFTVYNCLYFLQRLLCSF